MIAIFREQLLGGVEDTLDRRLAGALLVLLRAGALGRRVARRRDRVLAHRRDGALLYPERQRGMLLVCFSIAETGAAAKLTQN